MSLDSKMKAVLPGRQYHASRTANRTRSGNAYSHLCMGLAVIAIFLVVYQSWDMFSMHPEGDYTLNFPHDSYKWRDREADYPMTPNKIAIPNAAKNRIPRIQARFWRESDTDKKTRLRRQKTIKDAFDRTYSAYKRTAWLKDEMMPVRGGTRDSYGGWAVTLIEALDMLWLTGQHEEFDVAVRAIDQQVSFENTSRAQINVYESTIRFLGGLLSAYDLSGDYRLLSKARDVGDMLFKAFDTPNHIPMTRWKLQDYAAGTKQEALPKSLLAEVASLSLEFTRLSILTRDPKYHHAVRNISDHLHDIQMNTKVPGLWPVFIDGQRGDFDAGPDYTFGAMADGAYETLPKMVSMLGDKKGIYAQMHKRAMLAGEKNLMFRPMTPNQEDILFTGVTRSAGIMKPFLDTSTGHLSCFVGGMYALGGKLLSNSSHVDLGAKLARGCVWAYDVETNGVMPESFTLTSCHDHLSKCTWSENKWYEEVRKENKIPHHVKTDQFVRDNNMPPGFAKIKDAKFVLRPEAIESVFIMHRITGDPYWREAAWRMWKAVDKLTRTELSYSGVKNVSPPKGTPGDFNDVMESYFMGETLKYFYLIFSEPSVLSLDEWVFSMRAHPFKKLK